jgi:hypothetical protein
VSCRCQSHAGEASPGLGDVACSTVELVLGCSPSDIFRVGVVGELAAKF